MTRKISLLCLAVVLSGWAGQARAAIVNWNIDSDNSWVRLNLPLNVSTNLEGVNVNIRLRNANNSTWSDAGGRRSNFGGTLTTQLTNDSLVYLPGQMSATSINFGSFRPNAADFDPTATNGDNPNGQFTGTSGAPASFAVRINGNALVFINFTAAYLSLSDVQYAAAGTIPLVGGVGVGGEFGIQGGTYNLDGADVGLGIGQLLPDEANSNLADLLGGPFLAPNSGGVTITNLGGLDRRLDQVIDIPFEIPIDGDFVLAGSIAGHLRAFGTVPEPASLSLVGIACASCMLRRRRRNSP